MSFFRHREIYHFDEGAIPPDHALAHRNDEFPAGYSLAGCAPAEPAAASPAGAHLAGEVFWITMEFQRTARSALTVCLTPGDNPNADLTAEFASICFSHNEEALKVLELDRHYLCGPDIYACLPMVAVILRLADLQTIEGQESIFWIKQGERKTP